MLLRGFAAALALAGVSAFPAAVFQEGRASISNGKAATCRVNDRGPYSRGRVIDVSKGVAARLGMLRAGTAPVRITVIR